MNKLKLLVFLFLPFIIYSQNSKITDLERRLSSEKNQLKKLEILYEMVKVVSQNDLEQALVLAQRGSKLADDLKEKNWQPKFYEIKGTMHANLLQLDSANLYFDKAMKGHKAVKNVKGQATTSFKLAWIFKKNGEYEKAMKEDITALKLMESIDDKAGICNAMTNVSWDLTKQNRLKEAFIYAEKAIKMAEDNNLVSEFFYVYNNAGEVAIAMKKNQLALDYLYTSLPNNMKHLLKGKTAAEGGNPNSMDTRRLLAMALTEHTSETRAVNFDSSATASTGKGGKDAMVQDSYIERLADQSFAHYEPVRITPANSQVSIIAQSQDKGPLVKRNMDSVEQNNLKVLMNEV